MSGSRPRQQLRINQQKWVNRMWYYRYNCLGVFEVNIDRYFNDMEYSIEKSTPLS